MNTTIKKYPREAGTLKKIDPRHLQKHFFNESWVDVYKERHDRKVTLTPLQKLAKNLTHHGKGKSFEEVYCLLEAMGKDNVDMLTKQIQTSLEETEQDFSVLSSEEEYDKTRVIWR